MVVNSMRAAHAAHPDWRVAANACLETLASGDGANLANLANLGFVYATDAFAPHFADISDYPRDATGIEHWVGSVGLGICATGIEYFDQPALCLLTARFPESRYIHAATLDHPASFRPERVVFRPEAQPWDYVDPDLP